MEIYSTDEEGSLSIVTRQDFPSEEVIDELLYSNKSLMGDLYCFARQAKSGDRKHIADILAVDGNGRVFVVEVKNIRPRGEDILLQALRYVDWMKRNPVEVKWLWQKWHEDNPGETNLPEPAWSSLEAGVLLVAPSFDSAFVSIIVNNLSIPFRFLTIEKFEVGGKEIIVTNQMDQLEGMAETDIRLPQAKSTYSWETYLETATIPESLEKAKKLHDDVLSMLESLELGWLQVRFTKYYIAYKNGGRNVMELYFSGDGLP